MSDKPVLQTWLNEPKPGSDCAIIGEVAQAHDGSLGLAHAYVDAIATAGATAVKFQTHIAAAESTIAEPWRKPFSAQDASRYDYWRRMEFTPEQWFDLKVHAEKVGLLFISSPFSMEAFDLLNRIGVAAWKVASGEIANPILLDAMAATGKPVMLSTGMSEIGEIDAAVQAFNSGKSPLSVLQCSSTYPCPAESVGLNVLGLFRARYGTAVGLSDHSGTIFPGLAAAALGAEVVEVHVTLSREMFGPDVCASVTTGELRLLVDGIRYIDCMNKNPVDKLVQDPAMPPLRRIFMKSLVARRRLAAGTRIEDADLVLKKPGGGLPASTMCDLVGRRLRRDLDRDQQISLSDLE